MKLFALFFLQLAMLFLSVADFFAADRDDDELEEIPQFDSKLREQMRFRLLLWK